MEGGWLFKCEIVERDVGYGPRFGVKKRFFPWLKGLVWQIVHEIDGDVIKAGAGGGMDGIGC